MVIDGYTLVNAEKLDRAINGTVGSRGIAIGGVGPGDEQAILAEYDRLGGLILKGKYKVKTGSFYDLRLKKAIDKPKPVLVFVVNGEFVEVSESEPLPLEVRASEQQKTKKQEKAESKAKKGGKKGGKKEAPADDEEEDEDENDLA
jgi:hypothetical protein